MFDESKWIDCGKYMVSVYPQKSNEWKNLRYHIVGASNAEAAVDESRFKTSDDLAHMMNSKIDTPTNEDMERGVQDEPILRDWYKDSHNCDVEEIGLAVLKENKRVGCSTDGLVFDLDSSGRRTQQDACGCIEIKSVRKIPQALLNGVRTGNTSPKSYIYKSHYYQMIQTMGIIGLPWCDYIVGCRTTNQVIVVTVPFNQDDWNVLYGKVVNFINVKLL
jgi:hypothetical protein